ncbi:PQQ-dependent sugar dehydrogenase [Gammaproteobacteria bacterium]|nr:PQQ-dependent sugar dehydrogenase [Gammaproteobacteria bacterium]
MRGKKNAYGEFHPIQSGGRMVPYEDDQILFSIGDYRFRDHAQDERNVLGKIVAISIRSREPKIVSMGHRNVQGIHYLHKEDIIISTEHGPDGGNEINVNLSPGKEVKNYGWPISSYGEHYGVPERSSSHLKYQKAPLDKSHSDYGFVEPVKYFTPAIAISEIVKISSRSGDTNQFLVAAMGDKLREGDMSIDHIIFDDEFTLLESSIVPLNERVRDMIYIEEMDKVFLFMETTASIGILEPN